MVITKLSGGLGNQLFQYAAGKSLALHHSTRLLLDTTDFKEEGFRHFDLNSFNMDLKIADPETVEYFTNRSFAGKIRDRIFPLQFRKVYREPFFILIKEFSTRPLKFT